MFSALDTIYLDIFFKLFIGACVNLCQRQFPAPSNVPHKAHTFLWSCLKTWKKTQNESHRSLPVTWKITAHFQVVVWSKKHHHHEGYGRSVKHLPEERKTWVKQVRTSVWMPFPRKKKKIQWMQLHPPVAWTKPCPAHTEVPWFYPTAIPSCCCHRPEESMHTQPCCCLRNLVPSQASCT